MLNYEHPTAVAAPLPPKWRLLKTLEPRSSSWGFFFAARLCLSKGRLDFQQMDEHSSEAYRRNAETCRRLADATKDSAQKANWFMLAAEWKRLAEATERTPRKERS